MPYVSLWMPPDLEQAVGAAETGPLRPGLALTARELLALPRDLAERLVGAVRARRAEVVSRGYVDLPPEAPAALWRMNLSLGQQVFWASLGRMPTVAFGIPFPSLLLEAHLEAVLLPGPGVGVFLLEDGPGVPALELASPWPEQVPAGPRRDPESVLGLLGPGPSALDRWVEQHGAGLPPSELARFEPLRRRQGPAPPPGGVEAPGRGEREDWERLLLSWSQTAM